MVFVSEARQVVDKLTIIEHATLMFYCATASDTPKRVKMVIFAALAYLIIPSDLVPHFIPVARYANERAAIAQTLALVRKHATDEHRELARAAIERGFAKLDADKS